MHDWYWRYQQQNDCADGKQLEILMDSGLVQVLEYQVRHLRQDMPCECAFSVDDAEFFNTVIDYQEQYSPFSPTEQLLIALHAAAIARFGKPLMPQSWHFQTGQVDPWPNEHRFCALNSGFAKGNFLIIETDDRTALCMLVDPSFEVSTTKVMRRYDVIRVLKDRLLSSDFHAVAATHDHWQQFA